MSVFEYLLGPVGLGLLHVVLGACCVLAGLGVFGRPRRSGAAEPGARRQPVLVVGGVLVIAFGVWLAARGGVR